MLKHLRGKLFFRISLIILFFSSCVTQKRTVYLQTKEHFSKEFLNFSSKDYTLRPNDMLFIQISSLDDIQSTLSSNSASQSMSASTPYSASLNSYTVNKEGIIELPVIGKLIVKDKTIGEVTLMIKESLKNVLNQPVVSVRLISSYVSILGEVRSPGRFNYTENKISIFEALSMAGDITDYGDRKAIILIRNESGKTIRTELNLTQPEIITSEYYFIQPNDVIYVKPMKGKFWGFREFPFSTILASVSTTILAISFLRNFKN